MSAPPSVCHPGFTAMDCGEMTGCMLGLVVLVSGVAIDNLAPFTQSRFSSRFQPRIRVCSAVRESSLYTASYYIFVYVLPPSKSHNYLNKF